MDFKTLFEEARKVDPSDTISVSVEAWSWPNGKADLKWSIWSTLHKHFSAQTPDLVLRMYRDKVVDQPIEESVAAVGAPTV